MTDVISGHVNIVFSSLIQTTPLHSIGQLGRWERVQRAARCC
jgi:hypothetical protein